MKFAVLEPPKWVAQYDVWGQVVRKMEEKYGDGRVPYQAAVAYYKNKCRKLGLNPKVAGMEDDNGWRGIRPENTFPKHRDRKLSEGEEEEEDREEIAGVMPSNVSRPVSAAQTEWPCILKHDQVRVEDIKGREIGKVEKIYMDGSLDVDFPSERGQVTFVDKNKNHVVQKVGLSTGDKIVERDGSQLTVKTIHVNKEMGVYAATISHPDGREEVVVLENVERI
jgi:hypothetical protein